MVSKLLEEWTQEIKTVQDYDKSREFESKYEKHLKELKNIK